MNKNFLRKIPLDEFERILDMIVPKYGYPLINLEGSGEPTMAKDLDRYVHAVKSRNLKCYMDCNGARLNGKFMNRVIDAGIDFIRFSVIGYNREKYLNCSYVSCSRYPGHSSCSLRWQNTCCSTSV